MKKIRLFIEEKSLRVGVEIKISGGDFEYLTKVMRQKTNDQILVFNGFDGEFEALIQAIEKKFISAKITQKISELKKVPNVTLGFALVKHLRVDFIAQKAVELGVAGFQPIITKHTIADKINLERFRANAKEACEQCERNDFPQIFEVKKLEQLLTEKEAKEKIFILCDESGQGLRASELLPKINQGGKEIVILVGPEGGFSTEEFAKMRSLKNLHSLSLGTRILRSDTAVIVALALIQEFLK
jgi:16S rRNA (uracil1498-N3)-methyltransferase